MYLSSNSQNLHGERLLQVQQLWAAAMFVINPILRTPPTPDPRQDDPDGQPRMTFDDATNCNIALS